METPLVSRFLVPGGMGPSPPEADRWLRIAISVQAPRMWVPVGSERCSSPFLRAPTRLGLAPRQAPPRVVLTPRRSWRVLALISAYNSCPTLPRGEVGMCHHWHGSLRV